MALRAEGQGGDKGRGDREAVGKDDAGSTFTNEFIVV
jgi:hypothetical protein